MCLYHPALQCHWEVRGFKTTSDHKTFSDNHIKEGIFDSVSEWCWCFYGGYGMEMA